MARSGTPPSGSAPPTHAPDEASEAGQPLARPRPTRQDPSAAPVRLYRITDTATGAVVCDRARLADTFLTRLVGLLTHDGLEAGEGLLITPSSGVHTWGMSFPIDIVALDEHLHVTKVSPHTGPWRIAGLSLKTRSVLELPAGQIDRTLIHVGDALQISEVEREAAPN
jgi:uncharacterized membrane protein (UPF0127 family)